MYLILDVTPIEKPNDYKAPFSDVNSWPRMQHVSWVVLGEDLKPMENHDCIIKPEGYEITETMNDFGKLTTEEREKKEVELDGILKSFSKSMENVQYVIGHNINMSACVLAAEYMRKGEHPSIFSTEHICLMQEATWYCKIPNNRGGYKWPSLNELYATLFKQRYASAGNARADVIAAARSFIMLHKIGELEDVFDPE